MSATNKEVRRAIRVLQRQYIKKKHRCHPDDCSLCTLFYFNENRCQNCPNDVFDLEESYGCVTRGYKYPKLNMSLGNTDDNADLLSYYDKLYNIIPVNDNDFILTPDITYLISNLAKQYE